MKFIKWIRSESGSENQRKISKNLKYLFIVGDLVDGVGIYPGQEKEQIISNIVGQYEELARYLRMIPSHIKLIVCPGNHDAIRVAEPQLPIYSDFGKPIFALPNLIMVSNPGIVCIHKKSNFPGFKVLLYHGASFDFYANNLEYLRQKGGYNRGDLIMKFLLKRRHLAPTHKSTTYIPDPEADPLVINTLPDFFVTGHIHYSIASNYRNISMICCSCWQARTEYQEKRGHNPQPCRVPVVNLNTREIKILKFIDD